MTRAIPRSLLVLIMLASATFGDDVETKFLIPGDSIWKADFEDGRNPGKPNWQLRKSAWQVENGVLRGVNVDSGRGNSVSVWFALTCSILTESAQAD